MTTINCSSNCIHQKDGLCTLDNANAQLASTTTDCLFFNEKEHTGSMPVQVNRSYL